VRCLCATVRRAGRLLTRRYEEALRPAGVTVSQYELMMTLRAAGPVDQRRLAQLLETDQTTLSRNLKLLLAERRIDAPADARDGRRRSYRLTPLGDAALTEAHQRWNEVHTRMERALASPMAQLWPVLDGVIDAARANAAERR
jgi:DNA-binding MarR family transcriptional regulator